MNTLSHDDALLFHRLMDSLLLFVNKKTNSIKNVASVKELHKHDIQETMELRKKIFSDKHNLIELYTQENPDRLNKEELAIIVSWKNYQSGKFFVIKHLKEYSLFFSSDSQKVYGVKGITDSFEEKFRGYTPILLQISLIPFKEKIIYDGLFMPYNISFGGSMKKSLKQEAEKAIQQYGIISSLDQPICAKVQNDEEMLRFYMKSFDNKIRYEDEIHRLKKKSEELEAVYYQEEARDYARHPKKILKEQGIKGHFGVLIHTIVASAPTEKELDENIVKILPADKQLWIYKFKI